MDLQAQPAVKTAITKFNPFTALALGIFLPLLIAIAIAVITARN